MTDMPSIDYKVVIVMLLLQTCNSFILLDGDVKIYGLFDGHGQNGH